MNISEIRKQLSRVKNSLPQDKGREFAKRVKLRVRDITRIVDMDPQIVTKWTILGAASGAILDLIPGVESLVGVDGFVDVGAALGALVGMAKSEHERQQLLALRNLIAEELNEMAATETS